MEKGLYEIFANSWYRGGSVWLYSDPHFGDKDVAQFRKNNISDEEQVKRINSVLGQDDTLIILGDVGDRRYVKQLRGYKVLIMGNHEKGANNYRRRMIPHTYHSMEELYHGLNTGEIDYVGVNDYDTDGSIRYHGFKDTKLFDEVYEGPVWVGERLLLSHEPLSLPYALNIHGHDHANLLYPNCYNVCAEHIDYTPVCLKHILNSGLLKPVESIHRITIDAATARSERKSKK